MSYHYNKDGKLVSYTDARGNRYNANHQFIGYSKNNVHYDQNHYNIGYTKGDTRYGANHEYQGRNRKF